MGTRVSPLMRPLVVLVLFLGLQSPALAQAPAPAPVPPVEADPVPSTADSKLIQSVTFSPVVAFAGADIRVVVRVLPDAGNRRLQLSVDAPTFYASTERQIDGVEGARAHTFAVHQLPAGD